MSSTTIISALAVFAALACLLTGVQSTSIGAVEPIVSLDQMEPYDACLFICNICFSEEEDSDHLMDCSNRVCGPVGAGMCAMEKFIWLGHHCRRYDNVERMWSVHAKH